MDSCGQRWGEPQQGSWGQDVGASGPQPLTTQRKLGPGTGKPCILGKQDKEAGPLLVPLAPSLLQSEAWEQLQGEHVQWRWPEAWGPS